MLNRRYRYSNHGGHLAAARPLIVCRSAVSAIGGGADVMVFSIDPALHADSSAGLAFLPDRSVGGGGSGSGGDSDSRKKTEKRPLAEGQGGSHS